MKFTLSWLKSHLDTDADLTTITDALTAIGLELESVEDRAAALEPFTVGHVIEASPHPDADRLRVCRVQTGSGEVQVVCGAPNARTGMKGVFAPTGSHIPGTGLDLKKGTIRGVDSNGMLCSIREMGLGEDHDGIIELPEDAEVGAPVAAFLGADDPIIDVGVTPNRPDCLSVRGIARDLAAKGLGTLKPLDATPVPGAFDSPIGVRFDLPADRADACPMFAGRYFRGVRNGPSPQWMQDRLKAIGLRPISALVDITNFVTFDLGRPLHVFDADKVDGGIVIRMCRPGETLLALNGKEYTLDGEITGVCDESRVEGLGGIIGGEESGCTEETVNVFLEVALFDPIRTATTGRRLGVVSDARYRFERGLDPAFVMDGVEIASRLILELCGGEPSTPVVCGSTPDWERTYTLRHGRVLQLGGLDVPPAEQKRLLESLGFQVAEGDGSFTVTPPSWRPDIVGEADLVEEVLRINGYDAIPSVAMPRDHAVTRPARTPLQRRAADVRRVLAGRGFVEAVTFSFMSSVYTHLFGGDNPAVKLTNPISSDLDEMRPSVLPNLIAAAGRNIDRGIADPMLFEIGPQFAGSNPEDQTLAVGAIQAGNAVPRHWKATARPVDAFDAKAEAMAALAACGAPVERLQVTTDAPAWYHPGRSGALRLDPRKPLAWFGEVHPRVLKAMDVKGPMVAFELFPADLPLPKQKGNKARPALELSPFQPVARDFAFVVDADLSADSLLRAARGADKKLIDEVSLFDVYAGKGIEDGKKSLAISVTLQPTDATLTEEQIEAVAAKIVAAVQKQCGGVLRG